MNTDYHKEMVQRSLISTGNNYRMKKAISKAKSGQIVTVVYLGGSITFGFREYGDKIYAISSYKYFKEKFAFGDNIRYINAGMNGVTSLIGLIRLEQDVLKYNPDIVFVEYSVNDTKDAIHREAFESLIVRLLKWKSRPAVVLLFMQSEGGYTCQGHMQVIGENYNLPMISVCNAIRPELIAGRMKWSDYADDNIHPNIKGNKLVTDFIANYFDTVENQPEDKEEEVLNKPFYGVSYKDMKILDSTNFNQVSMMGFQKAVTINEFPNGWIRDLSVPDTYFRFKLEFRNLFIIYKESNDISEGSIEIRVDNENAGIYNGYRTFGWNNPIAKLVYSGDENKEHLVELTMIHGDEKKNFTILAFGYC
ncbi:MAG TPA: SGNH/GDSL hydrolase family protein [Mobilitalea sp.]|nr:SGNH/GDSL hydrolase family protein [Mobilitalea sp.]